MKKEDAIPNPCMTSYEAALDAEISQGDKRIHVRQKAGLDAVHERLNVALLHLQRSEFEKAYEVLQSLSLKEPEGMTTGKCHLWLEYMGLVGLALPLLGQREQAIRILHGVEGWSFLPRLNNFLLAISAGRASTALLLCYSNGERFPLVDSVISSLKYPVLRLFPFLRDWTAFWLAKGFLCQDNPSRAMDLLRNYARPGRKVAIDIMYALASAESGDLRFAHKALNSLLKRRKSPSALRNLLLREVALILKDQKLADQLLLDTQAMDVGGRIGDIVKTVTDAGRLPPAVKQKLMISL